VKREEPEQPKHKQNKKQGEQHKYSPAHLLAKTLPLTNTARIED
jgi:hypothetical protein